MTRRIEEEPRSFVRLIEGDAMLLELREYTVRVGQTRAYLDLYDREGRAVQQRHLGCSLGYFFTEIGELNSVVHLWLYSGFEDRMRRRAEAAADPEFAKFAANARELVIKQTSRILRPAAFCEGWLRGFLDGRQPCMSSEARLPSVN